jgi:hypothetical protein
MRKLLRSLLVVTAVLTLAPTIASAGPGRCIFVCGYETDCSVPCRDEQGTDTTCGEYGWCGPTNLADVTPSATRAEASRAEESAQVCSDAAQAAESAVSAES